MELTGKNEPKHIAELEALFFHYGEPLSVEKISSMLGISEDECKNRISLLGERLKNSEESGLFLMKNNNAVQLATKPYFKSIVEKIFQEEFKEELTPAALETISIIAYLGPIPRSVVDFVRGVNSSFILRNLLIRGLVERSPGKERKNVYEYRVSFSFLKHMGLGSVSDLPEYEKYKNILAEFEMKEVENKEEKNEQNNISVDKSLS